MVWCVNFLLINLFKSVGERQGQTDSKRPEVRVEGAGEGQTLFLGHLPPPWRGRSTWIRAAGPAGPGQRARGTPHLTSGCPAQSPSPPKEHRPSPSLPTNLALFHCISLIPPRTLQGRYYYYTSWLINWSSDKSLVGHMAYKWLRVQTQVVWCQSPTHNDPGQLQSSGFSEFWVCDLQQEVYTIYWLRYSIQTWNNIFHKETLCLILETSSDCPLFHTKMLLRDHLVDFTTNYKWLIDWKALVKTNIYLNM